MFFLKMIAASSLVFSSLAMAQKVPATPSIHVKFSVVDSDLNPIEWQSGWGQIDVFAQAEDGTVIYPTEEGVFELPAAGVYTFDGRGAYVCGMGSEKIKITKSIVEIRLFGWCE